MPFCWLFAVLDKRISTNIYGHFELFNFSSKIITLVAGLVLKQAYPVVQLSQLEKI
jgi:hypothetical protein